MKHTPIQRILGEDITKIIFIAEILLIYIYNGRQLNTFQTTFWLWDWLQGEPLQLFMIKQHEGDCSWSSGPFWIFLHSYCLVFKPIACNLISTGGASRNHFVKVCRCCSWLNSHIYNLINNILEPMRSCWTCVACWIDHHSNCLHGFWGSSHWIWLWALTKLRRN